MAGSATEKGKDAPDPHRSPSGPSPSCARTRLQGALTKTETLRLILARLDDMKAEDTVTIDLTGKTSIADAMVVTSGRSNRHVTSIAENAVEGLHKAGLKGIRVEGKKKRRLGADRCRRRHRSCVPAGGARLLRSGKDVGGQRRSPPEAGLRARMSMRKR